MDWMQPRVLPVISMVLLAGASLACAGELPQLGQSPTKDVIAAMTREEKVGLVVGVGTHQPFLPEEMQGPAVGEMSESVPGAAGNTLAIPRLGIPTAVVADGPAGVRIEPERESDPSRTFYCTAFPIATLLASSWDVDLLERVGQTMGNELVDYGVDVLLAPALNIHRNPLGGRNFEYYSEDPLVTGRLAAAFTKGVQSRGVGVSLKHFVANNHEWNRNVINVIVGQRALREIYLRGFEIAVREAAPWTIMSSYNKVNGTYTSESPDLLRGVVREDWGFDGLIMTDWWGGTDPVAQMKAGNELLMPGTGRQQKTLLAALESGELSEEVLDRNVEWILEVLQRTPAFEGKTPSNDPDLKAHAQVARDAAAQGMVLLENAGALPLATGAKVALFGNSSYQMITGGTGSGDVNEAYSISLLEGLKGQGLAVDEALAGAYATYLEEQEASRPKPRTWFMRPPPIPEREVSADEITRVSKETDVALVTVGRRSGEGKDREVEDDFRLTATETALLEKVAKAFHAEKKKVVVVLNIGGVIETASWRQNSDAIFLAWQPGQEAGHAIADVLTGRTNPSGKLATTFPLKWEDVPSSANFPGQTLLGPDPEVGRGFMRGDRAAEVVYEDDIWVGYRHFATRGVKVAYPFGYGLSYTTFDYGDVTLTEEQGTVSVSVPIKNTGSAAGREVVQLYVAAPGKSMPKPAIELRGFAKTKRLKPGESQTLSFSLGGRDLASFDEASSSWVVEAGTYTVRVGASSADIRGSATFTRDRGEKVESVSGSVGATSD